MDNFSIDVIERLMAAQDPISQWREVTEILKPLGGHTVNYALVDLETMSPLWLQSSMDQAWLGHYLDQAYYNVDPLVDHLGKSLNPGEWFCGTKALGEEGKTQDVALDWEIRDAGYRYLHGTPFAGYGRGTRKILTMCSQEDPASFEDPTLRAQIKMASVAIAAIVGAPSGDEPHLAFPRAADHALTSREKQIIERLARGLRNQQIAYELDVTEVTIRFHLANIRKKLGARTREEAVAMAIRFGLL